MEPKHVKNSDFLSILHSKPLREYKKPKFGFGDRVRISKYDLPPRKGYKLQFTQIFEIVAIATKKPPTYTIKDEQDEVVHGKIHEKELFRVIWVWIRIQSSWFPNASSQLFPNKTLSSFTNSCQSKGIFLFNYNGKQQLPRFLTPMYQNNTEGKFMF